MLTWESVEISINKIDVDDVITTSFGATDTPLTPPPMAGGNDDDRQFCLGRRFNQTGDLFADY